jgi:carbonic anhydrase/acetyltransferase-like protein (isoleucine patch superfamily)
MAFYELDGVAPECPPDEDFWVADSAHVIGKVTLGAGCGIWFGAVLRGDNERIRLGLRTNVQENCVLHTDMGSPLAIGDDCTIGHGAVVHGCTLGNAVLVGMGAVILNGAVIGDECLIGAGALVTEGKVFPPRSLIVGSPAKVVRELSDEDVARLYESARAYAENAKRFAHKLTGIA